MASNGSQLQHGRAHWVWKKMWEKWAFWLCWTGFEFLNQFWQFFNHKFFFEILVEALTRDVNLHILDHPRNPTILFTPIFTFSLKINNKFIHFFVHFYKYGIFVNKNLMLIFLFFFISPNTMIINCSKNSPNSKNFSRKFDVENLFLFHFKFT